MKTSSIIAAISIFNYGAAQMLAQQTHDPLVAAQHPELLDNKSSDGDLLDPRHYEVVLENSRVRVLRCSLKPRESTVVHHAPTSVLVCISGCDIVLNHSGNPPSANRMELQNGQTKWLPEEDRGETNFGTRDLVVLFLEPKKP